MSINQRSLLCIDVGYPVWNLLIKKRVINILTTMVRCKKKNGCTLKRNFSYLGMMWVTISFHLSPFHNFLLIVILLVKGCWSHQPLQFPSLNHPKYNVKRQTFCHETKFLLPGFTFPPWKSHHFPQKKKVTKKIAHKLHHIDENVVRSWLLLWNRNGRLNYILYIKVKSLLQSIAPQQYISLFAKMKYKWQMLPG